MDITPDKEKETLEEEVQSTSPTPSVESGKTTEPSKIAEAEQPHADKPQTSSAGVIVLQWLTYAFWGWLISCLIWVMSVVLANAILGDNVSSVIPYAVAGTVVLLPLAFVTDFFYRKHEPLKKAGGAMVLMVVHAVLFALLAIAALIVAVFVGINMAINLDRSTESQLVGILTSLTAAVLFAGAFIRALNPLKTKKFPLVYGIIMVVATSALLVAAIAGPIVASIATRDDRLIEDGLTNVSYGVTDYIDQKGKLPASLDDLSLTDERSQELVDRKLVEYKPEGKVTSSTLNTLSELKTITLDDDYQFNTRATFRYQLCVEYKAEDKARNRPGYSRDEDEYSNYLNTYGHGAGRTCYKLQHTTTINE